MSHPLDSKSPAARPNVRSASQRKLGKDGTTWTPTEQRKRDKAMRQFAKRQKGYGVSISQEYRDGYDAIRWKDEEE